MSLLRCVIVVRYIQVHTELSYYLQSDQICASAIVYQQHPNSSKQAQHNYKKKRENLLSEKRHECIANDIGTLF